MLTDTEAALIRRVRETLEALWDCSTALECGDQDADVVGLCERCSTLEELDELLARQ